MAKFFSIGHSNRGLEEFVAMLRAEQVQVLADVRSFPWSRSNSVFNIDTLPAALEHSCIGYAHIRALGGRRPKQKGIDRELNALWRVQAFHNYADYALGEEFGAAFHELVELGCRARIAIMCSEALWWRCHRRIISDYLVATGQTVEHILGKGKTTVATLTPGARVRADGKVVYPATSGELDCFER